MLTSLKSDLLKSQKFNQESYDQNGQTFSTKRSNSIQKPMPASKFRSKLDDYTDEEYQ